MITASSLNRIAICPASAALPQARQITDGGRRGTAIHDFLSMANASGREAALAQVDEEFKEVCSALDLDSIPHKSGEWASEVAFAVDMNTGFARELGRGLNRKYVGLNPSEIAGTSDLVGLGADFVVVPDYKSGFASAPPPEENLQLAFGGYAAAKVYGKSKAVLQLIHLPEGRKPYIKTAELSMADLHLKFESIRFWVNVVDGLKKELAENKDTILDTTMGDHCSFCPAMPYCPAYRSALSAPLDMALPPILTPEIVAVGFVRLQERLRGYEAVKKMFRDYAASNPVLLPNGRVYGKTYESQDVVDYNRTIALLSRFGADVVAMLRPKLSKSDVESAIDAIAESIGATKTKVKAEIFTEMREAGAMKSVQVEKVKEHKP